MKRERKEREGRGKGETSSRMRGGKRFVLCVWVSPFLACKRVDKLKMSEAEVWIRLSHCGCCPRPALTQQPLVQLLIPGLECYSSSFPLSLSPPSFPPSLSTAFLISFLPPTSQISSTAIAMVTDRRLQPLSSAIFFRSNAVWTTSPFNTIRAPTATIITKRDMAAVA